MTLTGAPPVRPSGAHPTLSERTVVTVWHGDKNISHNAGEILSKYDHVSRKYVVDVAGKLATEFKKVADYYGYKQVSPDETPEQAPADKGK